MYILIFMLVKKLNHSIYESRIKNRIKNSPDLIILDEMLISHKLNVEKIKGIYEKAVYWSKIVEKMQVDVLKIAK